MRFFLGCLVSVVIFFGCTKAPEGDGTEDTGYDAYEIAEPPEADTQAGPRVHVVDIIQMKFVPDILHVSKGDTVIWINRDIVEHDITEADKHLWRSSRLAAGSSWKFVASGSQSYYCSLHVVMKGQVIVDGKAIAMISPSSEITMCE